MTIQSRARDLTIADNPIAAIYLAPSVAQEDRIAELGAAIGKASSLGDCRAGCTKSGTEITYLRRFKKRKKI